MKYFLVEVKKAFGIYPLKAQIVMREKLVNGIFKKNVKVIKELAPEDLKKEFNTEVKYKIEENTDENTGTPDTDENTDSQDNDNDTPDTNTSGDENDTPTDENNGTDDVQTDGSENTDANTDGNDVNADENTGTDVDFEDMTTEELLKIANETYKLNKPSNTGRPNLLASLKEVTK